VKEEILYIL